MKKVLFAILAIAAFWFTGCEKDDYGDNHLLNNTIWNKQESSYTYSNEKIVFGYGGAGNRAYFECFTTGNNVELINQELEYSYSPPNIVLRFQDGSGVFAEGYIEGNVMHIVDGFRKGTYVKSE